MRCTPTNEIGASIACQCDLPFTTPRRTPLVEKQIPDTMKARNMTREQVRQ
jgi:hypothetical protein